MTPETVDTGELARLRHLVNIAMTIALWLHVPLIIAVSWLMGDSVLILGGVSAIVAGLVTLTNAYWHPSTGQRMLVGVGAVVDVSLLLAATAGSAWQVDIHMYYFAALAVLAAYCDRNVILAGSAVTAVHHLVLNFLAPA